MNIMDKGRVIIIPNDEILTSKYTKSIKKNHLEAFRDFSEKYNLGYEFKDDDYAEAPTYLALDGNLVLKTLDDIGIIIIYLPPIVTDRQDMFLHENLNKISQFNTIVGYGTIDKDNVRELEGLDKIVKSADVRNLKYEKEKTI